MGHSYTLALSDKVEKPADLWPLRGEFQIDLVPRNIPSPPSGSTPDSSPRSSISHEASSPPSSVSSSLPRTSEESGSVEITNKQQSGPWHARSNSFPETTFEVNASIIAELSKGENVNPATITVGQLGQPGQISAASSIPTSTRTDICLTEFVVKGATWSVYRATIELPTGRQSCIVKLAKSWGDTWELAQNEIQVLRRLADRMPPIAPSFYGLFSPQSQEAAFIKFKKTILLIMVIGDMGDYFKEKDYPVRCSIPLKARAPIVACYQALHRERILHGKFQYNHICRNRNSIGDIQYSLIDFSRARMLADHDEDAEIMMAVELADIEWHLRLSDRWSSHNTPRATLKDGKLIMKLEDFPKGRSNSPHLNIADWVTRPPVYAKK